MKDNISCALIESLALLYCGVIWYQRRAGRRFKKRASENRANRKPELYYRLTEKMGGGSDECSKPENRRLII